MRPKGIEGSMRIASLSLCAMPHLGVFSAFRLNSALVQDSSQRFFSSHQHLVRVPCYVCGRVHLVQLGLTRRRCAPMRCAQVAWEAERARLANEKSAVDRNSADITEQNRLLHEQVGALPGTYSLALCAPPWRRGPSLVGGGSAIGAEPRSQRIRALLLKPLLTASPSLDACFPLNVRLGLLFHPKLR